MEARNGPCQGCQRRFLPYEGTDGKMHTCRQECPEWHEHEEQRRALYAEKKARIAGSVGISPTREASRHKITLQIKSGKGRSR
jgi:hypothetical protein